MLPAIRISSSSSRATLNPTRLPPDPSRRFPHAPNSVHCSSSANAQSSARIAALSAASRDGSSSVVEELDDSPVSVELQVIDESGFDRVIAEAQQVDESVVVVWVASWCRKCIFLKPKLEKLAADYFPRLRFYCVDVNKVPHKLVARAGVTKMPTIQVWKDGKKQAEVIGGHKAHLVINEVREIIESDSDP